jgi:beta-glucosidase
MFATGIENSIPTINNGRTRVDQMEACGHYEAGARISTASRRSASSILRYGPPLHRTFLGPGKYDWEFADLTLRRAEAARHHADRRPVPLRRARLDRQFPEPGFPAAVRHYAGAFAERYPWVQLYTPVNEMFICAVFSPNTAGGTSS